jgi:ATP-binding cassette, subfamily C, bacterial CydC
MKAIARIAFLLWRAERARFAAGIAAAMATVLAGAGLLGLAGWFIASCALAGLAGVGLAFNFFPASAGIRFLALTRTASRYAERLVTHDAVLRFVAMLRVTLFEGVAKMQPSELLRWRSAELLHRLTTDVEGLDNIYLRLVLPAATLLAAGCALASAAGLIAWGLTAASLLLLALVAATAVVSARRTQRHARLRAAALEALRVRSIDLVRAQTDLAVAGCLGAQTRHALRAANRMARSARDLDAIDLACGATLSLLGSMTLLAAFFIAGHEYRAGRIDGGVLVAVLLAALAFMEMLAPLRRAALEFGRTRVAARRLAPWLSVRWADARPTPPVAAALRDPCGFVLRDAEFRYAARSAPVFTSLDLDIAVGERIALAGASGSGKSTLLAMLAGLIRPTSGSLRAGGAHLDDIAPEDHLARIGLLGQRTEIFNATVAENLRLAAPDASDAALWVALQAVELDAKVRAMPNGLETRLGEAGGGLSGGEARRLALARIVLKSPPVWLLDEPKAGLDEALAARVMANVMRHAAGATVVIATHHAREAEYAQRVVSLDFARGGHATSMHCPPCDMYPDQMAEQ